MAKKEKKEEKEEKQEEKKLLALHPQVKKAIILVALIVVFLVSILSLADLAGVGGQYFKKLMMLLFGYGLFLFPALLILAMILLFKRDAYLIVGLSILLTSLLGLFEVAGQISKGGEAGQMGGYIGLVASYLLLKYSGIWVSLIVLSSLMVVSLLILFNFPVFEILKQKIGWSQEEEDSADEIRPVSAIARISRKIKQKKGEDTGRIKNSSEAAIREKKNCLVGRCQA
jgi:flagellar basal body-associated protein FliL